MTIAIYYSTFMAQQVVDNTTDDPEGDLLKKIREKIKIFQLVVH